MKYNTQKHLFFVCLYILFFPWHESLRYDHLEIIFTTFNPQGFLGVLYSSTEKDNSWKYLVFSMI